MYRLRSNGEGACLQRQAAGTAEGSIFRLSEKLLFAGRVRSISLKNIKDSQFVIFLKIFLIKKKISRFGR